MSFLVAAFKIQLLSFILFSRFSQFNALYAYMYYEDAVCTGDMYVSGSLVYEYDDPAGLYSDGFTVEKYDGPCNYFQGGFYDFNWGEPEDGVYMTQGYCIRCNGVIGCSPDRNSCHEFSTARPPSISYDDDYIRNGTYTEQYNGFIASRADNVQSIIRKRVKKVNSAGPEISHLVGGAVGMVMLLLLLTASISAVKKLSDESRLDFCHNQETVCDTFDDDDNSQAKDYEVKILVPNFVV